MLRRGRMVGGLVHTKLQLLDQVRLNVYLCPLAVVPTVRVRSRKVDVFRCIDPQDYRVLLH